MNKILLTVFCMLTTALCLAQSNISTPAVSVAAKLDSIVIPEVEFRQANIRDVVAFLYQASREHDSKNLPAEKRGVNIVLMDKDNASVITLSMRHVTLRTLLNVVGEAAGLSVDVESETVLLRRFSARNGSAPQRVPPRSSPAQSTPQRSGQLLQNPDAGAKVVGLSSASADLRKKMQTIIIPELSFRQANIRDVVAFLNNAAKENDKETADPARKGVKIILSMPEDSLNKVAPITMRARFIALEEALKITTAVSGLQYDIDPAQNAVVLLDSNAVIRRQFPASRQAIAKLSKNQKTPGDLSQALGQYFTVDPKTKVEYSAGTGMLVIEGPAGNIKGLSEALPNLLTMLSAPPLVVQYDLAVYKVNPATAKKIEAALLTGRNVPGRPEATAWSTEIDRAGQLLRQSSSSGRVLAKRFDCEAGVEFLDNQSAAANAYTINVLSEISAGSPSANRVVTAIGVINVAGKPKPGNEAAPISIRFELVNLPVGKSGVALSADSQYAACLTAIRCQPGK